MRTEQMPTYYLLSTYEDACVRACVLCGGMWCARLGGDTCFSSPIKADQV
jgi:hypothetical protein